MGEKKRSGVLDLWRLALPGAQGRGRFTEAHRSLRLLEAQGNLEEALKTCEEFLRANPEDAEFLYQAGRLLLKRKEYVRAVQYLERAAKADPGCLEAWNSLGYGFCEMGKHGDAEHAFRKALALDERSLNALTGLVEVSRRTGAFERGVEWLRRATQLYPRRLNLWANLGVMALHARDPETACEAFGRALQLSPGDKQCREGLKSAEMLKSETSRQTAAGASDHWMVSPGRHRAILGSRQGGLLDCSTRCVNCGEPVIVFIPPQPGTPSGSGKYGQMICRHQCHHCESPLVAMTTMDGVMALGTECVLGDDRVEIRNAVELQPEEGAHLIRGSGAGIRLHPEVLVVRRQPDGRARLVTPEESGLPILPREATRVCTRCEKEFSEHGRPTIENKAIGGALCRDCGRFYCEPCVARALLGASRGSAMDCECRGATAALDENGELTLHNFEELVVFREAR